MTSIRMHGGAVMDAERMDRAIALLALLAVGFLGCEKPPSELHIDTTIRDLYSDPPGFYELYSPFDIPARGQNLVFLRQSKSMVVAAGDSIQHKIDDYARRGDFSLIGRRMGQPKIWFAVDGFVVGGRLVERVGHRQDWDFPDYEAFNPAMVRDFSPVDLDEYTYRDDRRLRRDIVGKRIRITGKLDVEELAPGVHRYRVESQDLKMDLTPVGTSLGYFLDLIKVVDTPFVAFGELGVLMPLDDGTELDRESSKVIGPFHVQYLRYSQDILVRNREGGT
jgi:hypothetical protein